MDCPYGGELTVTSLTTAISKANLFGQIINGQFQFGYLSSSKIDIKENSLKRGKRILTGYLDIYSKIAENHWRRKGGKEKGFLCTNNGITSLIIVLKDLLKYLDTGNHPVRDMSEEEVLTSIIPYASVLAEYFRDNDGSDTIDQLRGRSLGAHGQQQTALDMEVIISDTYNSFTSPQLEEHREKTKKIWDDMTRAAFPQLESNIIDTVISILKENFGSETSGWWKKGVPEEIRKEIGQIRESDEEERDYEYYINLSHIPKIVTESGNWSELFKDLFGFPQYGKKKDEQVRWLDDLVKIKNAINSNKRITQDDYNEMNDLRILFEKKCSDANRLVEIHETIIE